MSLDIGVGAKVDVGNPEVEYVHVGKEFNITHNVTAMWEKAGCYDALYESHGKLVSEILPDLSSALQKMQDNPAEFIALNPANGWGSYPVAVQFLSEVIDEFCKYPKAVVVVSR